MQKIFDSYKNSGNLHHAYFLVGDKIKISSNLTVFLRDEVGVKTSGSADFWHGKFHNMTVDQAKDVFSLSQNKDFDGGRKIFIIETDFITEEAQNSMLKFFEEPTEGTHFFIISPQDNLLPTLKSRVVTIYINNIDQLDTEDSILDKNLSDRLNVVKKITEAIKDEESTKQEAINLLNSIEQQLYVKGLSSNYEKLALCQTTRASLYDRGAPVKMILENLMINI